jgi:hypothetical protein
MTEPKRSLRGTPSPADSRDHSKRCLQAILRNGCSGKAKRLARLARGQPLQSPPYFADGPSLAMSHAAKCGKPTPKKMIIIASNGTTAGGGPALSSQRIHCWQDVLCQSSDRCADSWPSAITPIAMLKNSNVKRQHGCLQSIPSLIVRSTPPGSTTAQRGKMCCGAKVLRPSFASLRSIHFR